MKKEVTNYIRKYYQLPLEISDEQIENRLKNSFGELAANINISINNLKKAFYGTLPKIVKRYF